MTDLIPKVTILDEDKDDAYTNILLPDLIKSISIYIVKENLNTKFYNFSDFFFKHKITNDEVKIKLKNNIIKILQDKEYVLAYVFNKTGLIISPNNEQLHDNVWKSNLDFLEL